MKAPDMKLETPVDTSELDKEKISVVISVNQLITMQAALSVALAAKSVTPKIAKRVYTKLDTALDHWVNTGV